MQDAANHTAEAIVASAASKGMYTGAGITLGGWWTSNEFLGLAGLLIATLGFATNWYYKLTRAEIRALEAKEARELEEHRAHLIESSISPMATFGADRSWCDSIDCA